MCDYCLKNTEIVAKVRLRESMKNRWTDKVYHICADCKEYLKGCFKHETKGNTIGVNNGLFI